MLDAASSTGDGEGDGEGDGDGDGDADGDDGPYCVCQEKSYGEMIGCDNGTDCPYQWVRNNLSHPCIEFAHARPIYSSMSRAFMYKNLYRLLGSVITALRNLAMLIILARLPLRKQALPQNEQRAKSEADKPLISRDSN